MKLFSISAPGVHSKQGMYVNKATFLAMTAVLAAGGAAGGYVYRASVAPPIKEVTLPATPAPPPPVDIARVDPSAPAALPAKAAAPSCDDSVGTPADCPVAISSEDEGICNGGINWAAKRCAEFKADMKPKVAEVAVACLRGLRGAETCDQNRANLCGHQALMMACQEDTPDAQIATNSLNVANAPPLPDGASQLAVQCQTIVKGCSAGAPAATFSDCMRTLSGLNEVGRGNAVECMKTHCADKGFVGCEAVPPAVKTALAE